MEIRTDDDGWVFDGMDPLIADLFRLLPECAAPADEDSRRRIFSSPTGGRDAEADQEWREQVEPEMRELFRSHVDAVAADVSGIRRKGEFFTLSIPAGNAHVWIHTLNQARLALGARHGITEGDLSGPHEHTGPKAFAILQVDFYGMILGLLLSRTEI